jgi:hypothetical protein
MAENCRLHYTEQIRQDILNKYGVGKTSAQLVKPNIILLPIGGIDNNQNKLESIKNTNEWALRGKKDIDTKYHAKYYGSQIVIDNKSNPRGTLVRIEIKSNLIDDFEERDNPVKPPVNTPVFYQLDNNKVDYKLKAIKALESDKVRQPKPSIMQGFYNDLIKQGVSKEQLEFIKDTYKEGMTKEELIANLLGTISYTVEINTTKVAKGSIDEGFERIDGKNEGENTAHYSNLTVPGGTNYTENEISTPLITPSIKGHAAFSTNSGIGWFRTDDKQSYIEQDVDALINNMIKSGVLQKNCS